MNIVKASVLYRLLIVISVLWIIYSMIRIGPVDLGDFLFLGIVPIVIFWGIVWVIQGVINNHHLKQKNIDLIKGFDRIAMVIAIIAIIPSFLIGIYNIKEFRTLSPEYKAWEIKLENREKWLTDNFKPTNHKKLSFRDMRAAQMGFDSDDEEYRNIKAMKPRIKYKYPSSFECIMGGIVFALLSFAIMLFGIRGLTRATKWLYLWIFEAFKQK